VLIDTPPLLAVTDPCMVASRVDGVLLTFRLARNSRPAAERAREILATLEAKVLGVVVNAVDSHTGYGGYAYRPYHYYSYEENGGEPEENGSAAGNGWSRRR
jgi:Mrp family chromosome partitioning ATPase